MAKAKTPYRIVWRPMAEADLDNIIDYIAQDNPTRAETFGQELRDKTLPLAQHPKMGRTGHRPAGLARLRARAGRPSELHRVLSRAGRRRHRGNFASETRGAANAVTW